MDKLNSAKTYFKKTQIRVYFIWNSDIFFISKSIYLTGAEAEAKHFIYLPSTYLCIVMRTSENSTTLH